MNPWDFGWDAIAALAGVIAVVVAASLGWLGVRLAAKAVYRAQLDYVGQRADAVAAQLERLKNAYNELDTALIPYWETKSPEWRGGDGPEASDAHGKLLELQAACESLSLVVRGLTTTNKDLGGAGKADSVGLTLAALDISAYIEYVYFTNPGSPNTRADLDRFYERELAIYEPEQQDLVRGLLREVGPEVGLPNTTTTVSRLALHACSDTAKKVVIAAFELAGSDGH